MVQIDLKDWGAKEIDGILFALKEGAKKQGMDIENDILLCNLVNFFKEKADADPSMEDGDEYEIHIGNGVIGEMLYISGVVGLDGCDFEFDVPTFNKLGYSTEEIASATVTLDNYYNKESYDCGENRKTILN